MSDRTLVASATNLLSRGFLVTPTDRRSPAGEPTGALFSVARAIQRVLAFKVPARAVAVIETRATARPWPDLLAAQLPRLRDLVDAMGIHPIETVDEVDVVASYTAAALDRGDDVVIAGMDKRFAQLVSDRVWWYDANKDARYTPEIVTKRFGVGPDRVAEWLALVGDEDALPGIAGIGAKGATTLLETYGSIASALARLDDIRGRTGNALRADLEGVRRELQRARLDGTRPLPVSLDALAFVPPATAKLNSAFENLGFVELLAADGATVTTEVCATVESVEEALLRFARTPVAIELVLDGEPGAAAQPLVGLAMSAGDAKAVYVPLEGARRAAVARWLADASAPKLGHALEGATVALHHAGIELAGVTGDSSHASHLTEPSNWAPHDLPIVAKHALGRALVEDDAVRGVGAKRKAWSELPDDRCARQAGARADAAACVWHRLSPAVAPALLSEYRDLAATVVRMELAGLRVDLEELARAAHEFAAIETQLAADIETLAGHPFNINSSKQLGSVLFEELGLPIVSHTKTGWSTAIEALERIEHAHPIVPLVLRWRLLRRMRDTWLVALRDYVGVDGRVHSRTHPARSFSGRLVNTSPDLSRVPGRTPEMQRIRRAFVAPEGSVLMSVDYNQLGLHVLAHLTQDPALVEPLAARDDMHTLTAAAVLDKPRHEIGPDDRQLGKVVNFATFAGQGASALALQLGVPAQRASELIDRFDRRYARVRAFQDEQLRLARERGYVETLAGRRWPIGGLESLDPHDRSYAERLARRATHEGSVSDVSRRGLLEADRALRAAGLRAHPLVQILDEVLFEVPIDELRDAARITSLAMKSAFSLAVPLRVGVEAGPTWADLEPLTSGPDV